jgi:Holliday junction resolvasome RuvABC endonuclease subunit
LQLTEVAPEVQVLVPPGGTLLTEQLTLQDVADALQLALTYILERDAATTPTISKTISFFM